MKGKPNGDWMANAIAFIESRLTENLTMDELAGHSFFSKTHYQRLFHAMVGEPVMEYIKKRRLQLALRALCGTKDSILAIALQFGYESHEGFTRAFKNYYGVTPSRYRRLHAGKMNIREEVIKMKKLSKEAAASIRKNMAEICQVVGQSAKRACELAASIKNSANSLGNNGRGLLVCADEVKGLAMRMDAFNGTMESCVKRGEMEYAIYGEVHGFIKALDDMAFQMNLLRCFTSVEIARMGEPESVFDDVNEHFTVFTDINNQFAGLTRHFESGKQGILGLIRDSIDMVRADIKNDASGLLKEAAETLENAADEGKIIIADTKNVAASFAEHGKGVLCIANIMEGPIAEITNAANRFKAFNSNEEVEAAIKRVQDVAFWMNIAAFNMAVEAARSGKEKVAERAEKIRQYAWRLSEACKKCYELFHESNRLVDMLRNEKSAGIETLTLKMLDDIVFQEQIMMGQFTLEAARSQMENFMRLAKRESNAAHIMHRLQQTGDMAKCKAELEAYHEGLAQFTNELRAEAEAAGIRGGAFAFIASEYQTFADKVKSGIGYL